MTAPAPAAATAEEDPYAKYRVSTAAYEKQIAGKLQSLARGDASEPPDATTADHPVVAPTEGAQEGLPQPRYTPRGTKIEGSRGRSVPRVGGAMADAAAALEADLDS